MSELGTAQTIGKYEVLGTLGRGSMGMVYKARDPEIGRVVAIKTLRRPSSQNSDEFERALERFRLEAKSAGNLRHPNIITIFDINREGDMPYLVMDYVEGESLESILKKHARLDPRITFHYLEQVAAGLDAAHMKGVIHRDIKPSNLIVDRYENVLILDFGVAGFTERFDEGGLAQGGPVLGTPAYMSPEQIRNDKLDHRTDLFSLAIVTFECLTGTKPFEGGNFAAVISSILHAQPTSLTALVADLPLELEVVFEQALAKDRAARFHSGKHFIEACKKACNLTREEIKSNLETGRGPKRKKQPSYWRSLWEEQDKPQALTKSPSVPLTEDLESAGGRSQEGMSPGATSPNIPVSVGGGGSIPPTWGSSKGALASGAHIWNPSGAQLTHSQVFTDRSSVSSSSVLALSRSWRIRRLMLGVGLLCLVLSATIIFLLFENLRPVTTPGVAVNTAPFIFSGSTGGEGATGGPELALPAVAPVPEGKAVFEMTDKEILGVITSENVPEATLLKALREAKARSLPDLVDVSVYPLKNDSYLIRLETIKILGEVGDKRIVPVLVESLDDHDDVVRIQAAHSLAKLGDRRALGYLSSRLLKEEAEPARRAIKSAIDQIDGVSSSIVEP